MWCDMMDGPQFVAFRSETLQTAAHPSFLSSWFKFAPFKLKNIYTFYGRLITTASPFRICTWSLIMCISWMVKQLLSISIKRINLNRDDKNCMTRRWFLWITNFSFFIYGMHIPLLLRLIVPIAHSPLWVHWFNSFIQLYYNRTSQAVWL